MKEKYSPSTPESMLPALYYTLTWMPTRAIPLAANRCQGAANPPAFTKNLRRELRQQIRSIAEEDLLQPLGPEAALDPEEAEEMVGGRVDGLRGRGIMGGGGGGDGRGGFVSLLRLQGQQVAPWGAVGLRHTPICRHHDPPTPLLIAPVPLVAV